MDGIGLSDTNPSGGVVNCQFGIGPWEKFKISKGKRPFTGLTIESAHFANVFLKTGIQTIGFLTWVSRKTKIHAAKKP